jgi:hypothetical protein
VAQSRIEAEFHEHWSLSAEEMALLPGMADKGRLRGRLGFAIQLKFMQLHGRFPERHEEIDPAATQWLATQLHAPAELWSTYELTSRQAQRHQRTIREYLGFRPVTVNDLKVLAQWLYEEVLPFDPQCRHGLDRAIDWCRDKGLEPPAMDHVQRILRSAVRGFEAATRPINWDLISQQYDAMVK